MVFKPFDFGALGAVLSVTVLSAVFIYAGKGSQQRVIIKGPKDQWLFPQDAVEIISVPGPLGDTLVAIQDKQVRVKASPCDNQTCVAAGAIQFRGQWIACLPNKVLVSIGEGEQDTPSGTDDELDGAVW
ncbi:MAG: NusG domain II-containing protein [Treponema sp.]|jgi:hypothetical protein|nr:NusG domain II-containing protein [Treponema sp.]